MLTLLPILLPVLALVLVVMVAALAVAELLAPVLVLQVALVVAIVVVLALGLFAVVEVVVLATPSVVVAATAVVEATIDVAEVELLWALVAELASHSAQGHGALLLPALLGSAFGDEWSAVLNCGASLDTQVGAGGAVTNDMPAVSAIDIGTPVAAEAAAGVTSEGAASDADTQAGVLD